MNHKILIILGICSFCINALAVAQYQWRDANGNMQFSDRPPPTDIPEANIVKRPKGTEPYRPPTTIKNASNPQVKNQPSSLAERDLEFRKRQTEQAEANKKEAEKAEQEKQQKMACEQQRTQLAAFESGQRMSKFTENGERIILEDNQRNQEIARIRNELAQYCKN